MSLTFFFSPALTEPDARELRKENQLCSNCKLTLGTLHCTTVFHLFLQNCAWKGSTKRRRQCKSQKFLKPGERVNNSDCVPLECVEVLNSDVLEAWILQTGLSATRFDINLDAFVLIMFMSFSVIFSQEGDGNHSFKRFNCVNLTCSVLHNYSHRYPGVCDNSDFDRNPLVIIFDIHTSPRVSNVKESIFLQPEFMHANCSGR